MDRRGQNRTEQNRTEQKREEKRREEKKPRRNETQYTHATLKVGALATKKSPYSMCRDGMGNGTMKATKATLSSQSDLKKT